MMTTKNLKPLGHVREIVEAVGMKLSYAYEDLVFLEHSAFLLQFIENGQDVLIHINSEAQENELESDIGLLQEKAEAEGMVFTKGDYYRLSQADDENIQIEFFLR